MGEGAGMRVAAFVDVSPHPTLSQRERALTPARRQLLFLRALEPEVSRPDHPDFDVRLSECSGYRQGTQPHAPKIPGGPERVAERRRTVPVQVLQLLRRVFDRPAAQSRLARLCSNSQQS